MNIRNSFYYFEMFFSVLISDNEITIQSTNCKDKISTKKCKKLKKKGKCEDKKTWKKCMETCQKCTPGIIDNVQSFLYQLKVNYLF